MEGGAKEDSAIIKKLQLHSRSVSGSISLCSFQYKKVMKNNYNAKINLDRYHFGLC